MPQSVTVARALCLITKSTCHFGTFLPVSRPHAPSCYWEPQGRHLEALGCFVFTNTKFQKNTHYAAYLMLKHQQRTSGLLLSKVFSNTSSITLNLFSRSAQAMCFKLQRQHNIIICSKINKHNIIINLLNYIVTTTEISNLKSTGLKPKGKTIIPIHKVQ